MQTCINEEQKEILESLEIEKLTSDSNNKVKIVEFKHDKHVNSLAKHITTKGWESDEQGESSYYVVKDGKGQIIMYYAIRAGILLTKIDSKLEESAIRLGKELEYIRKKTNTDILTDDIIEWAVGFEQKNFNHKLIDKLKNTLYQIRQIGNKQEKHVIDVCREKNSNNYRTEKSFPAIEISHICTNESVSTAYKDLLFPQKVGQAIFWYKIVPELVKLKNNMGFQYIYVFAADDTLNKELISYYKSRMTFVEDCQLGAVKPRKNFRTTLLYQSMFDLVINRDKFLETYNDVTVNKDAV